MLQVYHIAREEDKVDGDRDARVTINPFCMQTVFSADVVVNGKPMKEVEIQYTDGDTTKLNVSTFDAQAIEDMVGSLPDIEI